MTVMSLFRNRRLRRWTAGGLAVTWLFTVLACAVDIDTAAADEAPAPQLVSQAHHHDGATQDDPCCQTQANAIVSFNPVKLPHVTALPAIVPAALLLIFALPFTLPRLRIAPDRYAIRRRPEFLVHSLQAQAPPR